MRGLKQYPYWCTGENDRSHLLQMRGLKLVDTRNIPHIIGVASFTDAWIETREQEVAETTKFVASFTDAWIETLAY